MADFPINPAVNDTFSASDGTIWTWDGYSWKSTGGTGGTGGGSTTIITNTFTANANQTLFTLSVSAVDDEYIIVSRNGVVLLPNIHYTLPANGNTITLTSNTSANDLVEARIFANVSIGATGAQGATGAGTQGATGSSGAQGATGSSGAQGTTGTQGTTGIQGVQGVQGTQGIQGANAETMVVTPDTPPTSADSMDDEFDGLTFDTAKWTASGNTYSSGNVASITQESGAAAFLLNGGTNSFHYTQNLASGTFKFRAKVRVQNMSAIVGALGNYQSVGIGLIRTASTKMAVCQIQYSGGHYVSCNRRTGTTFNSETALNFSPVDWQWWLHSGIYLEVEGDGTNLVCRASATGLPGTYKQISTETFASHLGGTPDRIAICGSTGGNANDTLCTFEWFRKVS